MKCHYALSEGGLVLEPFLQAMNQAVDLMLVVAGAVTGFVVGLNGWVAAC